MRTIVDLPEEQVAALAELCRVQGISRAEAVRRALAEMLAKGQGVARDKAFGAWKGRKIDSRKYIQDLRKEWDR
jgi:hypothetical protein